MAREGRWEVLLPVPNPSHPVSQPTPALYRSTTSLRVRCGVAEMGLPFAVSGEQLSRRSLQPAIASTHPLPRQALPPGRHPSAQPFLRSPMHLQGGHRQGRSQGPGVAVGPYPPSGAPFPGGGQLSKIFCSRIIFSFLQLLVFLSENFPQGNGFSEAYFKFCNCKPAL